MHPVLAADDKAKFQLDSENTQLPHQVTEVSTLTVSPLPQTDQPLMGWDSDPSPRRPLSLGIHLVERTCGVLVVYQLLFYYDFFLLYFI